MIRPAKAFSDDIGTEFGPEKCAKVIKCSSGARDKSNQSFNIQFANNTIVIESEQEEAYTYLGINYVMGSNTLR